MRTQDQPKCLLCQKKGILLYPELKDELFSSQGTWNIFKCPDPGCGLTWINPAPHPDDLHEAYHSYYTHTDFSAGTGKKFITNLRNFLDRFNVPLRRARLMYLNKTKPGRLLEIGCGDGTRLALLKNKGWQVEGIEIDPKAAQNARTNCNCEIHNMDLFKANFPENSFDAIIMNQVIEHIHNPKEILKECHRVLKTKGIIVIITPNNESLGHQIFRDKWLQLDPPRHLYGYSVKTLKKLLNASGFSQVRARTTSVYAGPVFSQSYQLKDKTNYAFKYPLRIIKSMAFKFLELFLIILKKNRGEDCVFIATK